LAPLPISGRPVSNWLGALISLRNSCCSICSGFVMTAAAAVSALA
jgi:hypothetical protein